MHEPFPGRLALPGSSVPVQDRSCPIGPEPEGDQQHHLLALALLALALAFVWLFGPGRDLDAQPNAIKLHHGRDVADWVAVRLCEERLNLVDALIDRAQPHCAGYLEYPFLNK